MLSDSLLVASESLSSSESSSASSSLLRASRSSAGGRSGILPSETCLFSFAFFFAGSRFFPEPSCFGTCSASLSPLSSSSEDDSYSSSARSTSESSSTPDPCSDANGVGPFSVLFLAGFFVALPFFFFGSDSSTSICTPFVFFFTTGAFSASSRLRFLLRSSNSSSCFILSFGFAGFPTGFPSPARCGLPLLDWCLDEASFSGLFAGVSLSATVSAFFSSAFFDLRFGCFSALSSCSCCRKAWVCCANP